MSSDPILDYLLSEDVDLSQLPPQIRLLVACIGLPATFALLRQRGGSPYTVPVHGEHSKVLANIMSVESAKALSKAYGGQTLTLPKIDKAMNQIRNRCICTAAEQGDSLSILAKRFDLTTRQISNILASGGQSNLCESQHDLFN